MIEMLIREIHDDLAQLAKPRCVLHGLGEEVCRVLLSRDVRDLDLERLDHVADVKVTARRCDRRASCDRDAQDCMRHLVRSCCRWTAG